MATSDHFDANGLGIDNGNLYGLPKNYDNSEVVIVPISWDATVSYGEGTSEAPKSIQQASLQVDLYDLDHQNFWKKGIYLDDGIQDIKSQNSHTRHSVKQLIELLSEGKDMNDKGVKSLSGEINSSCKNLVSKIKERSLKHLTNNKKVILLGGDHSTPLGYLQALSETEKFGILQIDAHCDLRDSYEYMKYSHASIMHNAIKLNGVQSLTQVGIRDFCEEEFDYISKSEKSIHVFYDRRMKERQFKGENWNGIVEEIVKTLPESVYLSFDIDGLNPSCCPNTGTPVMGGLDVDQALFLIDAVKKSGRKYVGMDLSEVGNSEWDANVGARVLYRMIGVIMN